MIAGGVPEGSHRGAQFTPTRIRSHRILEIPSGHRDARKDRHYNIRFHISASSFYSSSPLSIFKGHRTMGSWIT